MMSLRFERQQRHPLAGVQLKRVSPLRLVVLSLSVLLCVALTACGSSKSSTASGPPIAGSSSDTGIQKASLNDLLKGNKNEKCTFSSTDPTTHESTSGTVYVTGQRMRGDYSSTDADGKQTSSSTLRDNTYQYFWQGDSGYKMKIATIESTTTVTTLKSVTTTTVKDETTTTDLTAQDNTQYNYNCSKWTVDESLLTPPSNVNFVDYDAQIQQSQQQASQIAQQACNDIQDANTRAQCLSSVGK